MADLEMIEVTTPTCGVCKMIAKVVEKASSEFPEVPFRVLCAGEPEADEFARKHAVSTVPTFFVMRDGEVVDRHVGAANYLQLTKMIKNALEK